MPVLRCNTAGDNHLPRSPAAFLVSNSLRHRIAYAEIDVERELANQRCEVARRAGQRHPDCACGTAAETRSEIGKVAIGLLHQQRRAGSSTAPSDAFGFDERDSNASR
jgi:hypothetical protein